MAWERLLGMMILQLGPEDSQGPPSSRANLHLNGRNGSVKTVEWTKSGHGDQVDEIGFCSVGRQTRGPY